MDKIFFLDVDVLVAESTIMLKSREPYRRDLRENGQIVLTGVTAVGNRIVSVEGQPILFEIVRVADQKNAHHAFRWGPVMRLAAKSNQR